jgi:putative membrane protein
MKKIAVTTFLAIVGGMALGSMVAAHAADMSSYDKKFMEKAADAGSTEIAASKIAQSKSSNPQVKSFADTMVTEHTKVADELKQLASTKGVTLSDQPSSKHQAEITKLNGLSGADFDKEYAKAIGVSAHKDAVNLFTKASKKADDADVKAFALKTLPGLQHHLQMGKDLHASVTK